VLGEGADIVIMLPQIPRIESHPFLLSTSMLAGASVISNRIPIYISRHWILKWESISAKVKSSIPPLSCLR